MYWPTYSQKIWDRHCVIHLYCATLLIRASGPVNKHFFHFSVSRLSLFTTEIEHYSRDMLIHTK